MNEQRLWAFLLQILVPSSVFLLILAGLYGVNGLYLGFLLAGLIGIGVASMASFPFILREGRGAEELYDLGRALRLKGIRAAESDNTVSVPVGSLFALEIQFIEREGGGWTKYKLDWTPTALVLMLILMIVVPGGGAAVLLMSIVGLERIDRAFRKWVLPLLEIELPRTIERRDDVGQMLVFSLAEATRIACDVEKVKRSKYQDAVLLSLFFIGVVGGLVAYIPLAVLLGLQGPFYDLPTFAGGFVISMSLAILVVLFVRRRMIPKIRNAESWVGRLDTAMAREEAGVSVDGESAVGLLIEAGGELPEWLHIREKGKLDNNWIWVLLILFVVWPAASVIMVGVQYLLISQDLQFGALMVVLGAGLILAVYLIYRYMAKMEKAKSHFIRREWERRQQYLARRLEELIEGM